MAAGVNVKRFNFFMGYYTKISDYLSTVDWDDTFQSCVSVDGMVTRFYEILHIAMEKNIPEARQRSIKAPPVCSFCNLRKVL